MKAEGLAVEVSSASGRAIAGVAMPRKGSCAFAEDHTGFFRLIVTTFVVKNS